VIVISQRAIGEKLDGIREIAKIISNLVVKYSDIKDKVTIVLNKFNDENEYQSL
jgi:hypothetical protein